MHIVPFHRVPRVLIATGFLALIGAVPVAHAQSGGDLAAEKKCSKCHEMSEQSTGPSYKEVAKKYRGTPNAEATLAQKIKEGGKGVWGKKAMPPQNKLSDDEAKALAKWILSQT